MITPGKAKPAASTEVRYASMSDIESVLASVREFLDFTSKQSPRGFLQDHRPCRGMPVGPRRGIVPPAS